MEKSVTINKQIKRKSRAEWESLDKSELIDHILKLEAHNLQLKNLLQKKLNDAGKATQRHDDGEVKCEQKKASRRSFDFSKAHKRHVLLKILYFGWDYQGFACQEDSNNTVEFHLFEALTRTCLIESRANSNYHRCGRTDKGVSAFCQVISIDLRSKFHMEEQLNESSLESEIDYCGVLNRVLPQDIQCIAWMPLSETAYSARFDCTSRTYRYYFPLGSLNIDAMRDACKFLESHADFRNFCKMDVQNGVTNFMRHVKKATINNCEKGTGDTTDYTMCYLEITANAFLFHQIRCIMTILFLIGQGKEEVNIVSELLDIEKNPCKPQYSPASGVPLNLFHCDFKKDNGDPQNKDLQSSDWKCNRDVLLKLIRDLQSQWTLSSVKTTMIRDVIEHLTEYLKQFEASEPQSQEFVLLDIKEPRQYQKLLSRKRCESLENRIEHFVKKQRLVTKSSAGN